MSFPAVLEQENIEMVGYHDLNGRPGFKMAMHKEGDRWYLYLAHLWHPGWSVLDVRNPESPEHLRFIEGPANTWTLQV